MYCPDYLNNNNNPIGFISKDTQLATASDIAIIPKFLEILANFKNVISLLLMLDLFNNTIFIIFVIKEIETKIFNKPK